MRNRWGDKRVCGTSTQLSGQIAVAQLHALKTSGEAQQRDRGGRVGDQKAQEMEGDRGRVRNGAGKRASRDHCWMCRQQLALQRGLGLSEMLECGQSEG
jgi:hypothetical protein